MVTYLPEAPASKVDDWRTHAECAAYPNALFFPTVDQSDAVQVEKARSVCEVCRVSVECLQYALETNQRSGIWGGTTEKERRSLRRKWLAARRRAS